MSISLHILPLSFFSQEERCRGFVDVVRAWGSRYPVPHAAAHGAADRELTDSPYFGRDKATERRDGFDKVYEVFWLNVFGPKLVVTVGRERMLSTPAHRVEELPDGSILVVTWPTAADFASDAARVAQARALVHLRPELDFDTVLRTLRERSATLAPVEPRFHPDVATLLSRVKDEVAISERQRKIAELNAYRPPEPEEWLPAEAALPPDVESPARAVEHYEYLAERIGEEMNKVISNLAASNDLKGVIDVADWNDPDKLGKGQSMVDRVLSAGVRESHWRHPVPSSAHLSGPGETRWRDEL